MRQAKKEFKYKRKKVKSKEHVNAIECDFNGIHFKSKLELYCYKQLLLTGWEFTYEEETFILFKELTPKKFNIYKPGNRIKKLNAQGVIIKKSSSIKLITSKIQKITYTPDFIIKFPFGKIVIETKGRENESFPLRFKLFISLMESELNQNYLSIFVPKNQKQVIECISIIKDLINERNKGFTN